MTIAVFIDTVSRASPAVMLAVFIWGGLNNWWVYGRYHADIVTDKDRQYQELLGRYQALEKDRDKWIAIAMESTRTAGHAVDVAKGQEALRAP